MKKQKKKYQKTELNYEVMLNKEIALTYKQNYMQLSLFNIECFSVIQDFICYINNKMINDNLIINVD